MLAAKAPPPAAGDERDRTIVALRQRVAELETFRLGFRNMISRARSYKSQLLESRAYADSLHSDYNRLLGAHWSAATPAPPPSSGVGWGGATAALGEGWAQRRWNLGVE